MGRHSAPDDDADDVGGGVDLLSLDDGPLTGRHARVVVAPDLHAAVVTRPRPRSEPPVEPVITPAAEPATESVLEQTTAIPAADVAAQAEQDAAADGVAETAAATVGELVPVLPGEAVVPPPPDFGAGTAVATETVDPISPPERADGAGAASADLALLRNDASLRARCIGVFLAPFVIYVVVLLVRASEAREYLIWIWAPAIVGCVAFGALLDGAHKRRAQPG